MAARKPEPKATTRAEPKAKSPPEPEVKSQANIARRPEAKPTAKAEQLSLETAAPERPVEAASPQAAPEQVVELLHNRMGSWKRLASGEGVAITEKEWQAELSRLLVRRVAHANSSAETAKS
jgi:hypothetical protein